MKEWHNTDTWMKTSHKDLFLLCTHTFMFIFTGSLNKYSPIQAPISKQHSAWIIFVKEPEGLGNQTLKIPIPVTSEGFQLNFQKSQSQPLEWHWLWMGFGLLWNHRILESNLGWKRSLISSPPVNPVLPSYQQTMFPSAPSTLLNPSREDDPTTPWVAFSSAWQSFPWRIFS